MGCHGDVTVNVTSEIEFDNIPSLEWFLFIFAFTAQSVRKRGT
jgi:hypothetical protein